MHPVDDTRREYLLPDEAATLALGAQLADVLADVPAESPAQEALAAAVVYLEGDLGAGKTTLVRGLLRRAGVTGSVKSPTYTLVEPYVTSRLNLYHFDFYRFTHPEEFLDAGLDEYFAAAGACLVEWPDRAQPYLPAADMRIALFVDGAGRRVVLGADTERGRAWLSRLPASPAAISSAPPAPG